MPTDLIENKPYLFTDDKTQLPKRALKVKEYCAMYGVGHSAAYQQMASGELHSILVGRTRLIPIDAAEAMLKRPSDPMLPSHRSKNR